MTALNHLPTKVMQQVPDNGTSLPDGWGNVHHCTPFRAVQSLNEKGDGRQAALATTTTSSYNFKPFIALKDLLLPFEQGKVESCHISITSCVFTDGEVRPVMLMLICGVLPAFLEASNKLIGSIRSNDNFRAAI